MSNFFSNLFGGSKSKSKKDKSKECVVTRNTQQSEEDNFPDNLPVLSRRLSLSKSGRMKEKKRMNISVVKNNFEENGKTVAEPDGQTQHQRKLSLPGSDIFDIEGIEKAEKEHCQH